MPHPNLVSTTDMANKLRSVEASAFIGTCLVNPAYELAEHPDLDASLFLFDEPYFRVTADDRSQVNPTLRHLIETTEDMLMRCVFDDRRKTIPYQLEGLQQMGFTVQFDHSNPSLPLLFVRLANGIFFVDLANYKRPAWLDEEQPLE